jgi:hypothetical protein
MEDSFQERGRAMEDLYFIQKDQKLLEKLKAEMASQENRSALERATGIQNPEFLDKMLAASITPESLLALSLIPLVAVAWADESLELSEKQAILQAADIAGIESGSVAFQTLDAWLTKKPATEMLSAWEAYVRGMREKLDPTIYQQFKTQVLERAEGVAKAAGGFLGLGSRISHVEQVMLDRLAQAFEG